MAFDNSIIITRVDDDTYMMDDVSTEATAEESTIQSGRYLYYLTNGGENRVYCYHTDDESQKQTIEGA